MRIPTRRRAGALLVLATVISTLLPLSPMSAAADPLADKREEAERIARQLEQQSRRVSILAEDYDEARVRAEAIDVEMAATVETVRRTDDRAKEIRRRLKEQAVESYVRGGTAQALALLVDAKRSEELPVRTAYVRTITAGAADVLDELRAVLSDLAAQRERLAAAREEARSVAALAEAKRREAGAAEAAQRATLEQVKGELAVLVEAESARRAQEQAQRAQAEMAAAARARADAAAREPTTRDTAARATTTSAPRSSVSSGAPTSKQTTTTTTPSSGSTANPPPPSSGAEAAIAEARRQIGKPYEWGGSGPDTFDCSGLTSWAWRAGGKSLPHSSRAQWTATSRVGIDQLKPGDLVFYGEPIHHVGLFIGNGQMIEAPETGKNVRYASIFRSGFVGGGRVN